MSILHNWIIISLFVLAGLSLYFSLRPRYKPEIWLIVLTLFLFALPRAGIVLQQVNLPLPIGYVLVVVMILEWLVFRETRHRCSTCDPIQ